MKAAIACSGLLVASLALSGCGGGSSYGTSSPAAPSATGTTATPSTATTVTIVGSSGSGAFSPNPVNVSSGGEVVFQNNDTRTHHIVMDDGSADAGTIAPGATSGAISVKSGGNYHCSIHPSMVGSINGSVTGGGNTPYSAR